MPTKALRERESGAELELTRSSRRVSEGNTDQLSERGADGRDLAEECEAFLHGQVEGSGRSLRQTHPVFENLQLWHVLRCDFQKSGLFDKRCHVFLADCAFLAGHLTREFVSLFSR